MATIHELVKRAGSAAHGRKTGERHMRKLMRLLAVFATFALVAAACGGSDDDETGADTSATTEASSTDDASTTDETEAAEEPATEDAAQDFGDPVTINFGHPFPAQHPIQAGALEQWAAAVDEATDGTVTVEFFAGGALAPAPQTYENVVSGAQDVGWALQGYTPGRFPVTDVIEMPFTFASAQQATDVLWTLYEEFPEFQDEYADVKLLGMWVHDLGDLWIGEGKVETLEDINGLTLRAPSPVQNAVIEALGGNPVGLPAPELFDSLERGVIDGLFIANSGLSSFNLYEVLESGVECNCYVAAQFLVMNLDAWNSLSPAQQAAVDEVSGQALSTNAAVVYDGAYEAAAARVVEAGVEKVQLSEDELGRWKDATQSVIDDWISSNAGDFPTQAMYDRMLELAG